MVHDELVAAPGRERRVELHQAPWKDPGRFGRSLVIVLGSAALLVFIDEVSLLYWLVGLGGLLVGGAGLWPDLRRLVLRQPLVTATQQGVSLDGRELAWTDIASIRADVSHTTGDDIDGWVTPEAQHLLRPWHPWKARLGLLGLLTTVNGHLHGSKITEVALWLDTEARRRRGTP